MEQNTPLCIISRNNNYLHHFHTFEVWKSYPPFPDRRYLGRSGGYKIFQPHSSSVQWYWFRNRLRLWYWYYCSKKCRIYIFKKSTFSSNYKIRKKYDIFVLESWNFGNVCFLRSQIDSIEKHSRALPKIRSKWCGIYNIFFKSVNSPALWFCLLTRFGIIGRVISSLLKSGHQNVEWIWPFWCII